MGNEVLCLGNVRAPDGNPMTLGTVWIVTGEDVPVLVTAYPTGR